MIAPKKSFFRRAACASAALLLVASALAADPFTVADIRVEGLQRVEPGTVFATLPFRVGDSYNDDRGASGIRALFGLGLFVDVRVEIKGNVVTVIVQERPTIAEVDFSGLKEFDKDTLRKSLKDVGLADGRPYDKALVDKAEQELKRQYINRSLYGAEIVSTVTPIERNRVNLSFSVIEGDVAKIKSINIVGNQAFSTGTLRDQFEQDTPGYLSWYTKTDRYSRAKLNADLETVRAYYLQRGYLEMKIDSTQVAISPDKQDITITINITEGQRFAVSDIKLEGNYLGKEESFKTLVAIRPGEAYNADLVTRTTKAFSDYFATFGYAFAQIEVRPDIDRANNRASFVLRADPGRRAYVRRVIVSGNTITRDAVIRREFRQFESSWYDGDKIKLSRDRVDRLGYFKDVNIETQDVPGAPDQVDIVITVVEKPTGNFTIGAGFSSAEKLSLSTSIKQDNVFGSGNYLGLDVNTSSTARTFAISTVDPYFTKDGISRAIEAYYRTTRPLNESGGDYRLNTAGASLRFGVPFAEYDTVFFGLGLERIKIVPGNNLPASYLAYAYNSGYTSTTYPLTVGWSRDDRDNLLTPNKGRLTRLNGEMALFGDVRFVRTTAQYQEYFPITKRFTVALNADVGFGRGLNGQSFPVFRNVYSGGLGTVRGFEQNSLGPRDVTGSYVGGSKKLNFNAEVLTPLPGAGNDKSLRLYAFVDAGNVYGENEKLDFSTLRASYGGGLSWISPAGPLRFALARPWRSFSGDRIQKFQFQVGNSF